MKFLSISAFALDYLYPKKGLDKIRNSGADFLHLDIMDGKFVPLTGLSDDNIVWLFEQVKLPVDVHIMAYDIQKCIEHYSSFSLNSILFHLGTENESKTLSLLHTVQEKGIYCGLVISPDISVEEITPYIHNLDEILLMSATPGEPNSVFLQSAFDRVKVLRNLIDSYHVDVILSVDGGINEEKAVKLIQYGADKLVIGRAFFENDNPNAFISRLHETSL